jgi:Rha family phage regulatory protein
MQTELVTKDLTTTSLAIAELFGREHKHILRAIRNIIKDMSADDLTQRKIGQCFRINELANNKREPYFELGEEMTLIITGRLTGSEALKAQLKLADAFIAMRDYIRNEKESQKQLAIESLSNLQAKIDTQANQLQAMQKREPRDENSLAVILNIPSRYVKVEHDILERHGYLTSKTFTQTYHVKTPTQKMGSLCIGRKGTTLLYDEKIKDLIEALHVIESIEES